MKIPTYNARLSLTKQAPGVMVDASAAGQQARAIGKTGQALFAIGEKMREVQIDVIADNAIIQATNMTRQAELEASQRAWSEDYNEINDKAIENIRQHITGSVKDPVALQKVNQWLNLNIPSSQIKMKQYGYQKMIDTAKTQVDIMLFDNTQEYLSASEKMKPIVLDKRRIIYEWAAKKGVMTNDDTKLNMRQDKGKLAERQASYDAANRPEVYFEKRGSYGIASDKLADTDMVAEKTISRLEVASIKQKFDNQRNFDLELQGQTIAEQLRMLEDGAYAGQYDEEWAKSKKKAILSNAEINPIERDRFASELSMSIDALQSGYAYEGQKLKKGEVISLKTAKEYLNGIGNILNEINQGVADGLLDPREARDFLSKLYDKSALIATERAADTGPDFLNPMAAMRYDLEDVNNIFKRTMNPSDRHRAVREFFFRTDGKNLNRQELENITKDIIKKAQNSNYPEYGVYIVGDIIPTSKGNFKIVGLTDQGEPIVEVPDSILNKEEESGKANAK